MNMRWLKGPCCCVILVMLLLSGCAFFKLEEELVEFEQTFWLTGKITHQSPRQKEVVIVLYRRTSDGNQVVTAKIMPPSGEYDLEVRSGDYYIVAFEDLNGNLNHDSGESVGYYGKPDKIIIQKDQMPAQTPHARMNLDFTIAASTRYPDGFTSKIPITADITKKSNLVAGDLITFENRKFSMENAKKGYWEPLTFIREVGVGIFFLEKYDPGKVPVLFVHGAVGTPLHFKAIANHIDRDRFQPWLYYYPSGMLLSKVSNVLNFMIMDLQKQYGFEKLVVVAHSMGGLVARKFILQNINDDQQDYIGLFISISTPWSGHRMAEKGVKQAPTPIPSWHDMVPDSAYIQSIFARKLPDTLPYYLMFSHKGDHSRFMENNDGSVELASQLDYRAQVEAVRIFGYNEDHVGILSSQRVFDQINDLLETAVSTGGYRARQFGITN